MHIAHDSAGPSRTRGAHRPRDCASPREARWHREDAGWLRARRQRAAEQRDVEAFFDNIVAPDRSQFLATLVESWRAGDWAAAGSAQHDALANVLRRHQLDGLRVPLGFDDRARLQSLESLPAVLAEVFAALDGEGPRGVPLWDLLPQPLALIEVGATDEFDSAAATASYRTFDRAAMRVTDVTDRIRFYRDRHGRWRVSVPGF